MAKANLVSQGNYVCIKDFTKREVDYKFLRGVLVSGVCLNLGQNVVFAM